MPRRSRFEVVDFAQYQQTAEWVKHLLTVHGGIYLTETNGIFQIWLLNPSALLSLPRDVGTRIAETVDRVVSEMLPLEAIERSLSDAFVGQQTDVPTMVHVQSAISEQLNSHVDLETVYHRLESALIHALYAYANIH